jgi:hypothetical protein
MVISPRHALLAALSLTACQAAGPATETATSATTGTGTTLPAVELDPIDALTRASLDLRGVRPTVAEIESVEGDPSALDAQIDAFLQDPRFGQRAADLWSEVLLTRTDYYTVDITDYGLYDVSAAEFSDSVGDEPLQIIARVADEDLPWTELVTGDWTMANELLERVWPVERTSGEPGWQVAHYTDQRPSAGLLTTNAVWWRFQSTDSNANRKRANQVSRIFLCNDYLVRPIEFDRNLDLLDEEAVLDALATNPSCVNCHASLDPIASYFYGFWHYDPYSAADITSYHPERELQWKDQTGVAPGYYGEPGYTLHDLGRQIAGDSRFVECAVQQATELLLARDAGVPDMDRMTAHREAFLAGGLTLRSLVGAIVRSPEYSSAPSDDALAVPLKQASPELLASQVEDLTGFRWTYADYDLLRSAEVGFRTLAGGADGTFVTENAHTPNATLILVQKRLAEAAASYAVRQDQALPAEERRLLTVATFAEASADDPVVAEQIAALHLRVLGNRFAPTDDAVTAYVELWRDLHGIDGDPATAWTGVVSAFLRDPDLLLY